MIRHLIPMLLATTTATIIAPPLIAAPQSTFGLSSGDSDDGAAARLLGVLTYTPLTLQFEEVPARDAFKSIAETLHITLIGRWSDEKNPSGIDPEIPVSLTAEGRPARDVIEELLEQCEDFEDCTWQMRAGALEIGTKRRLSVPAARQRRTYDLTDLLLEPPYFVSPIGGSNYAKVDSPYVDAVLGASSRAALREGLPPPRKSKTEILLELAEGIVETVEPGRWDLGSNDSDVEADDANNAAAAARNTAARDEARRRRTRLWASMRAFRESLIITAPDFMHRQIGGYPRPIKPVDADTVRLVPSPVASQPPAAPAADDGDARANPAEPADSAGAP